VEGHLARSRIPPRPGRRARADAAHPAGERLPRRDLRGRVLLVHGEAVRYPPGRDRDHERVHRRRRGEPAVPRRRRREDGAPRVRRVLLSHHTGPRTTAFAW
jgi:hypothetical protein